MARPLWGAALSAAVLPLAMRAQAPTLRTQVKPTFTVQHVIEAVDLQATPVPATQGQAVTFRFKLKNTGTTVAITVPWALEVDGVAIGAGNSPGLKPGETWESTKGWSATPGAHTVRLVVDPAASGGASGAPASARSRQLGIAVAALPATEVRQLDWDAAKAAGMNYTDGLVKPTTCQGTLKHVDRGSYQSLLSNASFTGYVGWVHIMLQCPLVTGARMQPVVYDNLVLKNGWRVKEVKVIELSRYGTGDWQFAGAPPTTGSDRPRVALNLWANQAGALEVVVRVQIEGPRGTDPYR